MEKDNRIECCVKGRYALFSDPVNRIGGEKMTYQVPTYQALKGIMESIYWKPTFQWIIDGVRIIKPICSQSQGIRPINFDGGNTLSIYTYLADVEYQIQAHFEWNENRPNLAQDRNENKHFFMAKRSLEKGGRRDVFLGTRECQGYAEPCIFGAGTGAYDAYGTFPLGVMFHGFTYPDEAQKEEEKGKLTARFWKPVMDNGYIRFIRPEECQIRKVLRPDEMKEFDVSKENLSYV